MQDAIKVVIADDEKYILTILRTRLKELGYSVVAEVTSGEDLIEAVSNHRPGLVITDILLIGLDGLTAIQKFFKFHPCAVIVISNSDDEATLERASQCPVQAYIPKPITLASLSAGIIIATKRFEEFIALQNESDLTKQHLAERVAIEKAKGILMKRAGINADLADQKMRNMARESSQTIGQIAASLLLTDTALSDLLATKG